MHTTHTHLPYPLPHLQRRHLGLQGGLSQCLGILQVQGRRVLGAGCMEYAPSGMGEGCRVQGHGILQVCVWGEWWATGGMAGVGWDRWAVGTWGAQAYCRTAQSRQLGSLAGSGRDSGAGGFDPKCACS